MFIFHRVALNFQTSCVQHAKHVTAVQLHLKVRIVRLLNNQYFLFTAYAYVVTFYKNYLQLVSFQPLVVTSFTDWKGSDACIR